MSTASSTKTSGLDGSIANMPSHAASDPEKQVGETYVIPGGAGAIAVDGQYASEYAEYRRLKDRFDGDAKARKRMMLKLDLRVIPMLWLYYVLNSIDRANAGNVKIYSFLDDTHMTPKQFNMALTWFFFTYAGFEAPSNMLMRRVGPRLWLSSALSQPLPIYMGLT